jgi:hypothetical protein
MTRATKVQSTIRSEKLYEADKWILVCKDKHISAEHRKWRKVNSICFITTCARECKFIHKKHANILDEYFKQEYEIGLNGSFVSDFADSYNPNFNYVVMYLYPKRLSMIMKMETTMSDTKQMITIREMQAIILKNIWDALPNTKDRYTKFFEATRDTVETIEEIFKPDLDKFVICSHTTMTDNLKNVFTTLKTKPSYIALNTPQIDTGTSVVFVDLSRTIKDEHDFIDLDALERNCTEEILYAGDLARAQE